MSKIRIFLLASAVIGAGCLFITGYLGSSPRTSVSAVEAYYIGVYWDEWCTSPVDSIEWGDVYPGSSKTASIFVVNEADRDMSISLDTSDWTPPQASEHMSLQWNHTGTPLRPGESSLTTLRLSVSPLVKGIDDFDFKIVLSAAAYEWCTISEFGTLFSDNSDVRMIYPSDSDHKPHFLSAAKVSDWLASAFIYTELGNVREALDTDYKYVDRYTGEALGEVGTGIVSFGGPFVNPIVKYAEMYSTPQGDRAPIRLHIEGDSFQFRRQDGSSIPGADLPASAINGGRDMFVIEVYEDGDGKIILLCYGFGWKGTYAAGKYFFTEVCPDLASYPYGWIIVEWEDANGDGFVNTEMDGDAYTLIAASP